MDGAVGLVDMHLGRNSTKSFSVAPMMDLTDKHCRVFHRQLSAHALLYTEMLTAGAVIHGDRNHLLGFSQSEHPVALQLGGSEPADLAEAARIGEDFGYREINLNCGCPSDRVQSGRFGASLMAEPQTVARCITAMQEAVDLPVTVKCRLGIDHQDTEADLTEFIDVVAAAGCRTFIVHARKAWLQGLNPKQNRTVPPVDYDRVYRLKNAKPDLKIVINGGIQNLEEAATHLQIVDGVMLGRAAYQNPWLLSGVDQLIFGSPVSKVSTREQVVRAMVPYIQERLASGDNMSRITRHMVGLFHGQPGSRYWRRTLSEEAHLPGAGTEVLENALAAMSFAARSHQAAE
jgi:tRNA-dihydrouridine synthase A